LKRRTVLIGGITTAALATLGPQGESLSIQSAPAASRERVVKALRVENLRCEYIVNPLGIDVPKPRLSWALVSDRRGARQTAYQIRVASTEEGLQNSHIDLWDSGKVASSQSVQVPYEGPALASRQRCFWQVSVWDGDGIATTSAMIGSWEMGLLSSEDWHARWLGAPAEWPGRALYFRGEFSVQKPIQRARAYVTGLGYYELRVNGEKVGDHKLDPGWTDYTRRIQYATYDITNLLQDGANVLGAVVGNGWHGSPIFLLQAEITYADNSAQQFSTGGNSSTAPISWNVTSGPILSNSIYGGETYDARLEKPGWDSPGKPTYTISNRTEGWVTPKIVSSPGGTLVSQLQDPIKIVESFKPRSKTTAAPGIYIFDAGHNLAGWAELSLNGKPGQRIVLKFGETLFPNGTVNQDNLRTASATDEYICKGDGAETWEPTFTYHGFRYLQVEGFPGVPDIANITIKAVRSSVQPNGQFSCGNPLINQIQQMIWRTEASNLYSVPTDCPQRDERLGWMNDLTVRLEESLYNFHLARFYSKFLDDVSDTQDAQGAIADTAPFRWGNTPADPVSASYLLMGWLLYRHYGDREILAKHFDGFKAWVDFLLSRTDQYIVTYGYYGDWSPPAAFSQPIGSAVSKNTPVSLMSTGYLYYTAGLISKMATVLGRAQDAASYSETAAKVATAFNLKYWDETKGGYGANNQAANAFALYIDIVPSERISRVVTNLVNDVKQQQYHLTTGNLCTKYVLESLTRYGHADSAFRIATQETYPSWGYMLANNATTLWERWEDLTGSGMNSHNHPMMGSVSSWFYKHLAGINVAEDGVGFDKIEIRPYFVNGLSSAEGQYETMYGIARSSWRKIDNKTEVEITVPANTQATLYLPAPPQVKITEGGLGVAGAEGVSGVDYKDGVAIVKVGSGTYRFSL
jgi:alpha-L-rhamnosidase